MVVGTDVEEGVILTIIPTYKGGLGRLGRLGRLGVFCAYSLSPELSKEPTARHYGRGLQKLEGGGGAHLAADDADQIVLDRQLVDGHQAAGIDDDAQRAAEGLHLLALPVEAEADGDIGEGKRGALGLREEKELIVQRAVPHDTAIHTFCHLRPSDRLRPELIGAVENKVQLAGGEDTHSDARLGCQRFQRHHTFNASRMGCSSSGDIVTSRRMAAARSGDSRWKSSWRGVMSRPHMSSAPGLTSSRSPSGAE